MKELRKKIKKMLFAIDEARYILKNSASLQFLEQAVRHSRHYNLSIIFITQTIGEFFEKPESEAIANNCALKTLLHTEGFKTSIAEKLGLTPQQANFVRNALPGEEDLGFSEALFGFQDKWFPLKVEAIGEIERSIINFQPANEKKWR